jgi:hypothetical protein
MVLMVVGDIGEEFFNGCGLWGVIPFAVGVFSKLAIGDAGFLLGKLSFSANFALFVSKVVGFKFVKKAHRFI